MKVQIEYETPEEGLLKLNNLLNDIKKITSPSTAVKWCAHFSESKQEHFAILLLDGAHNIIECQVICIGLVNRTIIHPREVFRPAIQAACAAIILVHNHPSGSTEPSREDIEITDRLKQAGDILGITVLDHLIVHGFLYRSMLESGDCSF